MCDTEKFNELFGKQSYDISVINLNIRSINKNYDEFLLLLEAVSVDFDVIILTETWQIQPDLGKYELDKYKIYYNFGNINQNDGVIIYVRDGIEQSVDVIKLNSGISFLRLECKLNSVKYGITAVYRSPSLNADEFLGDLRMALQGLDQQVEVFAGDINIDLLDSDSIITTEYLNLLNEFGYTIHLQEPTRVTTTSKTCIDHFFVKTKNNPVNNIYPVVIQSTITDHYPTALIALLISHDHKNLEKPSNNSIINTDIRYKIDINKLTNFLSLEHWDDILNTLDTDISAELFMSKLKTYILESRSITKVPCKNKKLKPWMTNGILASIRKRNKLHTQLINNPENVYLSNYYKQYRNNLTKLIKLTKDNYYKAILDKAQGDLKKTWQIINEATNSSKKRPILVISRTILTEYCLVIRKRLNILITFFKTLRWKCLNRLT